ncbi:hypothetical protein INT46_001207 [Mucor plumbeus]|uniref:Uncharacterized protein n=1 Tax=Mucor plumbeus TaxID=97098 RepID=A0A8H7UU59_9FUNG|nr:hypothetical protein INT46_001207 [Mucor plumbeus]
MNQGWVMNSIEAKNIATHYAFQNYSVVYVRRKTKFKLEYFELCFKIGEVELLATGGFWKEISNDLVSINPFLGSSIPNLPNVITGPVTNASSREIFYC